MVLEQCNKKGYFDRMILVYSFILSIIDRDLYRRIDSIGRERNDVIHQFWYYSCRGDNRVLRKKLEKVARVASVLVATFNALTREIGVNEVYRFFL